MYDPRSVRSTCDWVIIKQMTDTGTMSVLGKPCLLPLINKLTHCPKAIIQ